MEWQFGDLKPGHYGVILADPPWHFKTWSGRREKTSAGHSSRAVERHYPTMSVADICDLPVADLAADDCILFLWTCWPVLQDAFRVIKAWGFVYKTCGFSWMKADPYRLFADEKTPFAGLGYWTRANTEPCLLATRGRPKRHARDVRQGVIAPRREHSRKPDCVYHRIQRLVDGPYADLFARQRRAGWDVWGNEVDKFDEAAA